MHRFLSLFFALLISSPALATWRVAETPHVRIYGEMSAASLQAQARLIGDYRQLLSTMTNGTPAEAALPLDVYIVPTLSEASPFTPMSRDVAGFYKPSDRGIAAFVMPDLQGREVLLHEYAHHYMFSASKAAYPAWYVEGFAEYFMTAEFKEDRIEFGEANPNRAGWLLNRAGGWLPLEKVLNRSFKPTPENNAMFYAQSWLLTHYLFRVPGQRDKLNAYLKAIALGGDPVGAFQSHVEPDFRAMERQLQNYISSRRLTYSIWKRPALKKQDEAIVRELDPAADKLLLLIANMDIGANVPDHGKAWQKVQAAVAQTGPGPMAERALLLADLRFANSADAAKRAERLLAANPDDADLLRWQAEAILSTGRLSASDLSAARRLLVRAFKHNQQDWRVMHVYLHTFDLERQPLEPDKLDVLWQIWMLTPQVDGIALDLAAALVQLDRWDEAQRALAPVANRPHGGGWADLARRMTQIIGTRDKAAFVRAATRIPEDTTAAADP